VGWWYDEVFRDQVRFGLKVRRVVYSGQSEHQKIEVLDTEPFGRVLVLDGVFMTSEADDYYYHEMIAHPAMTTAPRIRRVLVIGGGDGGTIREVLRHPEVESVVLVEIDGRVVEVCREHLASISTSWDDPRLEVVISDGIAFAREAAVEPFDVVLLDGCDPVGPSEGLFDEPFFRDCSRLLRADGVFAMQSETPTLMLDVFLDIVHTLRRVFGRAWPYFGSVPLYASGMWSWTYASRSADPRAIVDERMERLESVTRYYNREIHLASLAVPNALEGLLA
jgi:spermidine synthase